VEEKFLNSFFCPVCLYGGLGEAMLAVKPAELVCPQCDNKSPIVTGIPRFVDRNNYTASFGFQWNKHRRTQLDSHSALSLSKDRLLQATGWKDLIDASGLRVLEAGSGAGRFTEVLAATGARVWSFDYSSAVEANAANNGTSANLILFQGDIYQIPLADGYFDWVLCLGVIQHTPDPGTSFRSLARKVRPGGWLVLDVYTRSLGHAFQWKYLLRPITRRMDPRHLHGILVRLVPILLPVTQLLKRLLGPFGARLSPIVEYSQLGLSAELNAEWALLDSFDMYAPAHDHPQSMRTVRNWFIDAGFSEVEVFYGANGVVGRGRRVPPGVGGCNHPGNQQGKD
jgi:SAM-dependent methyltransferase